MINNYICENCDHFNVCKVTDKLVPFTYENKKDLGVVLTIDNCKEYKEVE